MSDRSHKAPSSEVDILEQLRREDTNRLIGDDASFLPDLDRPVVTVDQQISGVHFVPDLTPEIVARRLLAVNLSDLAAVGAEPRYAWLALAAPRDYPIERFLDAFRLAAKSARLQLAGGDLARSPTLSASLTLLGELSPSARELRRSCARPGDTLWIGGGLGRSALGRDLLLAGVRPSGDDAVVPDLDLPNHLIAEARRCLDKHLAPEPQLPLGRWLSEQPRVAAIDVSDGLVLDLHRLGRASAVDGILDLETLQGEGAFFELARLRDHDGVALALYGGEDYVLLFTLPRGVEPPREFGCRAIGAIVTALEGGGAIAWEKAGGRENLEIRGWDHFVPDDQT